ncbi:MAG: hypothetical protein NC217_07475 [Muribaculaceae bacterium]|nr:hypothetical protein [Muribaculaceae bacterium]
MADGRKVIVANSESGETLVLDNERGHMLAHDDNGENVQPYRPGANVGVWNDEQLAKLGALQPAGEQPATVPISAENVPKTVETAVNPTENAVAGAEIVPNPHGTVENVQQPTALQRLPKDEKGNPMFEQAESADHGWDALVEFSEGDKGATKEIADVMVEEKHKAFEKAQKLKSKGKTPTEILASRKANAAELAKAQNEYEQWQKIAAIEQSREASIRSQQEAEARQRAMERAEAEKTERAAREEQARIEREALEGIPEWHLDTPENARARGARRYQGARFTRQEPVEGVPGKEVEVKFSQKDLPKGKVAVIEASQLQPSHIQGQRNPMFFIDESTFFRQRQGI